MTRLSWRKQGHLQRQHKVKCQERERSQAACYPCLWLLKKLHLAANTYAAGGVFISFAQCLGAEDVKAKSCLAVLGQMTESRLFVSRSCPPSPCTLFLRASTKPRGDRRQPWAQGEWAGGVTVSIQRQRAWSQELQTPSTWWSTVCQGTNHSIPGRHISPVQHSLPTATPKKSAPGQFHTGLILPHLTS